LMAIVVFPTPPLVLAMARIIVMANRCSLYAGRIDHSDTNAKQCLTAAAARQAHSVRSNPRFRLLRGETAILRRLPMNGEAIGGT
jgi:hypothetical protein